jgi:hypothetical protein
MAERLGASRSFVPLVFSAFGYIPDTALDFLSFVFVTGSELHLNSYPTGPRGLRSDQSRRVSFEWILCASEA